MKTRAAVAWKSGAPLSIEEVDLDGPRAGEVLVEIKATWICHTDCYTLSGADHGYYFISTFIEDHLAHHARQLLAPTSPA